MVSRRELLKSVLALPFVPGAVAPNDLQAQEAWPTRTITVVVPFPPGGTSSSRTRAALAAASGTHTSRAPSPMATPS